VYFYVISDKKISVHLYRHAQREVLELSIYSRITEPKSLKAPRRHILTNISPLLFRQEYQNLFTPSEFYTGWQVSCSRLQLQRTLVFFTRDSPNIVSRIFAASSKRILFLCGCCRRMTAITELCGTCSRSIRIDRTWEEFFRKRLRYKDQELKKEASSTMNIIN